MKAAAEYRVRAGPWLAWGALGLRGVTIVYLSVMILIPIAAITRTSLSGGVSAFQSDVFNPVALASLKLTLLVASVTTVINAVIGTLTAYVLVRYQFPGRRMLDGLADASFAIPTLVTGLMLVVLFGPQTIIGSRLAAQGMQIIFAKPGMVMALLFVTYPFVIRTVQPVLLELSLAQEEAAHTIGASKLVAFRRIVLPTLMPAIMTGSLLSFARALGEFGSIVVVAGNIPFRTLTAPVYVFGQVESENVRGASAVSLLLLAISFTLMIVVDVLQQRMGYERVCAKR
jgi:sulfate/thiosulfate transport system permease protein